MASFVVGIVACIIFQFFPQSIVNIFGSERDLYNEFTVKAVRTFLLMCIPASYQVCSGFFLQAIGKLLPSMLLLRLAVSLEAKAAKLEEHWLQNVVQKGGCVIVERCADYILRGH